MGARVSLTDEDLDALADRVAERLGRRRLGLVTVDELADELRLDASWVYEHQIELGAIRLGPGSRAPLRFNLDHVCKLLESGALEGKAQQRRRPGRPAGPARGKSSLPPGVTPLRVRGARP